MSPRKKEDFEKIREERKTEIRDTAFRLFAEKGFRVTSIAEVAREAGVSKGLIYNYYDSKEALLVDALSISFKKVENYFPYMKSGSDLSAAKIIERYIRDSVRMLTEESGFWRYAYALVLQRDVATIMRPLLDQFMEYYMPLFFRLFEEMGYENPAVVSNLFGVHFDGIALAYAAAPDLEFGSEEAITNALIDLYIPKKLRRK